jgi:hypothetical protein
MLDDTPGNKRNHRDREEAWKELGAIAKRQGMSLDIRSNIVAIDGNKGSNELFAVSCEVVSKKDRILLLCVEVGLQELKDRQVSSASALGAVPHPASRKVSKT